MQTAFLLHEHTNEVSELVGMKDSKVAAQGLQDIHFVNHLVVQAAFANQWFKMMQFGGFTNDF